MAEIAFRLSRVFEAAQVEGVTVVFRCKTERDKGCLQHAIAGQFKDMLYRASKPLPGDMMQIAGVTFLLRTLDER